MDVHSTVEEPPEETHSYLYNLAGGIIALLTLVMPVYITAHYSSSSGFNQKSDLPSSPTALQH